MKIVEQGEHPVFGRHRLVPGRALRTAILDLQAAGVKVTVYPHDGLPIMQWLFRVGALRKIGACEVIRQAQRLGVA